MAHRDDQDIPCAVDGCPHAGHGGSALCAAHKRRRALGQDLEAPLRTWDKDPEAAILAALEKWREALEKRKAQLAAMTSGNSEFCRLLEAVRAQAEVAAEDDAEWHRARRTLHQALARYVERRRRVDEPEAEPAEDNTTN